MVCDLDPIFYNSFPPLFSKYPYLLVNKDNQQLNGIKTYDERKISQLH